MNKDNEKSKRYELIRRRWDSEDSLLVSRTRLFLMANSIFLAASQLREDLAFSIGVTVLSLVISFLWLTTSWHSFNVILHLYREAKDYTPAAVDCVDRIKPVFVRPNTVFGKLLPIVLILAWVANLAWCIRSLGYWAVLVAAFLLVGLGLFIVNAEKRTRRSRAGAQWDPPDR